MKDKDTVTGISEDTNLNKRKAICFIATYIGIGSPVVLFILITIIVVIWKLKIEYLINLNTLLESSGFVDVVQEYIMPAWEMQETQLINSGYKELIILHRTTIALTLMYTSVFISFFWVRINKIYYSLWELRSRKQSALRTFIAFPLVACFFSIGVYLEFFLLKFDFHTYGPYAITPTVRGLYLINIILFLSVLLWLVTIFCLIPIEIRSYQENKKNNS